jgi:dihydrofolate reductase
MEKPRISIIANIGEKNRALGKHNELLWKISDDLKRFKALTTGHPIIMGRKTYESIGRPLPNRTNIVISRQHDFKPDGVQVAHSLDEALAEAKLIEDQEIFIIGGGEVYKESLPFVDRLYLTLVHEEKEGDVFFPDYSAFSKIISQKDFLDSTPSFSYVILEK